MKTKEQNKHFLWLPYTSKISLKKESVSLTYNSGTETLKFSQIHSIMFYGSVIDLPQKFLEECVRHDIPITIHRRNMTKAVWILPSTHSNAKDILTKQILARENSIKQRYIARQIVKAKIKSTNWLVKENKIKFNKNLTVDQIRSIEAVCARHYWRTYFQKLGHPEWTRRGKNPVAKILDAVSKFIAGILLRWTLYHNLSPHHGYLHVQTEYPALIYDFMDPYRGYFEKSVFKTVQKLQKFRVEETDWIGHVVANLKLFLTSQTYTDATRQIVTHSELMHGVVLAFRSYLLGKSYRFIIPIPGKPNGGRPLKTGYTLYGHRAGRTDFWKKVEKINKKPNQTTSSSPVRSVGGKSSI